MVFYREQGPLAGIRRRTRAEAGLSRGAAISLELLSVQRIPEKECENCEHALPPSNLCAVFPGQTNETGPDPATPQIGGGKRAKSPNVKMFPVASFLGGQTGGDTPHLMGHP